MELSWSVQVLSLMKWEYQCHEDSVWTDCPQKGDVTLCIVIPQLSALLRMLVEDYIDVGNILTSLDFAFKLIAKNNWIVSNCQGTILLGNTL